MNQPASHNEEAPPFVVPCRTLGMDAPCRWLRAGWRDLRRTPALTAVFGAVIVVVSVLIAALAWKLGRFALLATLLSGFVFVAPLIFFEPRYHWYFSFTPDGFQVPAFAVSFLPTFAVPEIVGFGDFSSVLAILTDHFVPGMDSVGSNQNAPPL